MELDTNPTKPTKCVRLIEKSLGLIRSPTYRELTVYKNVNYKYYYKACEDKIKISKYIRNPKKGAKKPHQNFVWP